MPEKEKLTTEELQVISAMLRTVTDINLIKYHPGFHTLADKVERMSIDEAKQPIAYLHPDCVT